MPRRRAFALASLLLILVAPPAAHAHGDGEPWIYVAADSVEQAQPVTVFGLDMAPDARVSLSLSAEGQVVPLTDVVAAEDGHFQARIVVPAHLGDGYAEIRAIDSAGLEASTWIVVGDAPPLPGAPVPGAAEWWTDPSVIVLLLFVVGAILAVGYLLLRKPSAAQATRTADVVRARPLPSKQRRARRRAG